MKSQGETTKKVDKIVKVTKDFISSGIGLKKLKSISSIDDYDVIVKNKVQNKTYLIDSSLLGGSGIQTIAEGTNITVDDTDPLNPIVSASSSLFPNGQEIVTESRDFRDSDIGKILIVVGNDITLTMPDSIVFSEQLRTIGLVFLKGYTGCGYQPSHGFTTKVLQLPNDGEFITLITGEYLGKSSVGSIANMQVNSDDGIVTLNKYLYDQSQNVIPLSGTVSGSPVTGDIQFEDNKQLFQGNDDTTKVSVKFKNGELELTSKDNINNQFSKVATNVIGTTITANDGTSESFLKTTPTGILLSSDYPTSKGLTGEQDFSPNITDLDYTQKIYVGFRGTATLSSGTVTVTTDKIKTGYKIYLSVNTPSGTQGFLSAPTGSIVNETEFVINSTSATDDSTVNWWIAP